MTFPDFFSLHIPIIIAIIIISYVLMAKYSPTDVDLGHATEINTAP